MLVVVRGSGVGKTTLIDRALLQHETNRGRFVFLADTTTRAPRDSERTAAYADAIAKAAPGRVCLDLGTGGTHDHDLPTTHTPPPTQRKLHRQPNVARLAKQRSHCSREPLRARLFTKSCECAR